MRDSEPPTTTGGPTTSRSGCRSLHRRIHRVHGPHRQDEQAGEDQERDHGPDQFEAGVAARPAGAGRHPARRRKRITAVMTRPATTRRSPRRPRARPGTGPAPAGPGARRDSGPKERSSSRYSRRFKPTAIGIRGPGDRGRMRSRMIRSRSSAAQTTRPSPAIHAGTVPYVGQAAQPTVRVALTAPGWIA